MLDRLDRGLFRNSLLALREKVLRKEHTTVASFSNDVVSAINSEFGNSAVSLAELIALVSGRAEDMSAEERDRRTLARRIVKGIEPLIENATRNEAELNGRPYAEQIREMDEALLSRRGSLAQSVEVPVLSSVELKPDVGIASPVDGDVEMIDAPSTMEQHPHIEEMAKEPKAPAGQVDLVKHEDLHPGNQLVSANTPPASMNGFRHEPNINGDLPTEQIQQVEPPTPPMSLQGHSQLVQVEGGIPWYVEQFDPVGTTIFEERWTGPEVLRDMSEELSEMDEDELQGLGPGDDMVEESNEAGEEVEVSPADATVKKKLLKGKRGRASDWGTRSFRNRR
jgi:NuA3 HAT complex component NTO1